MATGSVIGALEDRVRRVVDDPRCVETRLEALTDLVTPTGLHFVRNHFPIPSADAAGYELRVEGAVRRPRTWNHGELTDGSPREVVATMECAGNGRSSLTPRVDGIAWDHGAVGTARWSGVPLGDLVRAAEPHGDACEVVLEGADDGHEPGVTGRLPYAMSIPLDKALEPDCLVAVSMNGRPLRPEHGYPARAIVPGYYGMASVKWLRRIRVVSSPFDGFFRSRGYAVFAPSARPEEPGRPVGRLRVKALITGTTGPFEPGPIVLRGFAWSGERRIARVEVALLSAEGLRVSTVEAQLGPTPGPWAWTPWTAELVAPGSGEYTAEARATDSEGESQPDRPIWNPRGLEANGPHAVAIRVASSVAGRRSPIR